MDGEFSVGVPEITPVVGSRTRPVGNAGETVQETTAPPPADGDNGVIGVPFSYVNGPLP